MKRETREELEGRLRKMERDLEEILDEIDVRMWGMELEYEEDNGGIDG